MLFLLALAFFFPFLNPPMLSGLASSSIARFPAMSLLELIDSS